MVIDLSKKPLSQLEVDALNGILMGMSYERYKKYQRSLARKRKKRTRKAGVKKWRNEEKI